jgi:hypothetical protein
MYHKEKRILYFLCVLVITEVLLVCIIPAVYLSHIEVIGPACLVNYTVPLRVLVIP